MYTAPKATTISIYLFLMLMISEHIELPQTADLRAKNGETQPAAGIANSGELASFAHSRYLNIIDPTKGWKGCK